MALPLQKLPLPAHELRGRTAERILRCKEPRCLSPLKAWFLAALVLNLHLSYSGFLPQTEVVVSAKVMTDSGRTGLEKKNKSMDPSAVLG